jgi:glycosyltransferase involved in cell wall biosynthesis
MRLVGVINEPPFAPGSWSGTAPFFFRSLQRAGALVDALNVKLPRYQDAAMRALNMRWPLASWREHYHLDTRMRRLETRSVAKALTTCANGFDSVVQIGAYYCSPDATDVPCFSYHDGNLATRIRSGHIAVTPDSSLVRRALDWERHVYSKMSRIFTFSRWLARSFVADFGVPESRVVVAGAGINFEQMPAAGVRSEYRPDFLIVGRDFERKGGKILLEAFPRVRRALPHATLTIVGPELNNLPEGVRCLGFLSKADSAQRERLQQAFREAGAYVLPSLYEPFGISLLEAMANELPCIVADHCAMPEIVANGTTGLVARPGDSESLAAAMIEIGSSASVAREFGLAGRLRMEREFTWDAVAQRVVTAMREALATG